MRDYQGFVIVKEDSVRKYLSVRVTAKDAEHACQMALISVITSHSSFTTTEVRSSGKKSINVNPTQFEVDTMQEV